MAKSKGHNIHANAGTETTCLRDRDASKYALQPSVSSHSLMQPGDKEGQTVGQYCMEKVIHMVAGKLKTSAKKANR
jgi:hypothetical protein